MTELGQLSCGKGISWMRGQAGDNTRTNRLRWYSNADYTTLEAKVWGRRQCATGRKFFIIILFHFHSSTEVFVSLPTNSIQNRFNNLQWSSSSTLVIWVWCEWSLYQLKQTTLSKVDNHLGHWVRPHPQNLVSRCRHGKHAKLFPATNTDHWCL